MYSELFDQLGANTSRNARESHNSTENSENEALVSFKAGKMELKSLEAPSQFECTPIKTRGEVRLVWKSNDLQWQWYDRREKKVQDTFTVKDFPQSTFERIPREGKSNDRIFVWTRPTDKENPYVMYWMQDASEDKEDEITVQVNQYLVDPQSAAPEGAMETEATETGAAAAGAAAADDDDNNNAASITTTEGQVDALSNILENLGMPQGGGGGTSDSSSTPEPSSTAAGGAGNTLTLADLQGAMAGIQQQQQATSPPGPALSDVVTPEAITGILADTAATQRLLELLPEEQRTAEQLEENLRSPQVQQTLRTLTATLLPDEGGDLTGLYSVLANFQLEPADGQAAIAQGNPIQAFLDALIKSVEKEQEGNAAGDDDDDDDKMEEDKDES